MRAVLWDRGTTMVCPSTLSTICILRGRTGALARICGATPHATTSYGRATAVLLGRPPISEQRRAQPTKKADPQSPGITARRTLRTSPSHLKCCDAPRYPAPTKSGSAPMRALNSAGRTFSRGGFTDDYGVEVASHRGRHCVECLWGRRGWRRVWKSGRLGNNVSGERHRWGRRDDLAGERDGECRRHHDADRH